MMPEIQLATMGNDEGPARHGTRNAGAWWSERRHGLANRLRVETSHYGNRHLRHVSTPPDKFALPDGGVRSIRAARCKVRVGSTSPEWRVGQGHQTAPGLATKEQR